MADIGLGFRVSYTLWGSSVRSIKRVGSGSEGGAAHGQTLPGGGGKRRRGEGGDGKTEQLYTEYTDGMLVSLPIQC